MISNGQFCPPPATAWLCPLFHSRHRKAPKIRPLCQAGRQIGVRLGVSPGWFSAEATFGPGPNALQVSTAKHLRNSLAPGAVAASCRATRRQRQRDLATIAIHSLAQETSRESIEPAAPFSPIGSVRPGVEPTSAGPLTPSFNRFARYRTPLIPPKAGTQVF